ncbi:hypothetical protein Agub_g9820 [Astrephomene gubernaculifera]|uniref:Uncharacterized protein n=1 Tax=Astrephomene gubernaculifera TaxID=47775 RepID=A0AAD3DU14_9CHLO|nr:hypothetical protein Agub_g9820 [Astrephomene gubernaculifera]
MSAPAIKARPRDEPDSEDSVAAEFGGDYSEASLELIRTLGRKGAQFGEVEPSEEAILQPPSQAACDAAVESLAQLAQQLQEVEQHTPDAREREWVGYKRSLVEDADTEDVNWLKLKAYHHGVDRLRAARGENAAGDNVDAQSSLEQLSSSTIPTFSEREAMLAASQAALPSTSETEYDNLTNPQFQCPALLSAATPCALAAATSSQTAVSDTLAESTASASAVPVTSYRDDYLEEQYLSQRLAAQQRQRSRAFQLGLVVAIGASVLRWWVRRSRGGGNGERGRGPQQQQPQQLAAVASGQSLGMTE